MAKSNNFVTARSVEEINTANITPVITREVQRLTKELIQDTFEALTSGITYQTINYIEGDSTATQYTVNFSRRLFNDIAVRMKERLDKGLESGDAYLDYLSYFSVRYNENDGKPQLDIKLQDPDFDLSDINIINVVRKEEP